MKYIRTKDGRISYLTSEPNEEIPEYEIVTSKGTVAYRMKSQVVKVANTIEELCDCFVYGKCDYMELEEAQQEKEFYEQDLQRDGQPIYGAIWTDKGLIYVAKMNEKGELKLL